MANAAADRIAEDTTITMHNTSNQQRIHHGRNPRTPANTTTMRPRGVVQLVLQAANFFIVIVSVFLPIGSLTSTEWYGEILEKATITLWSMCVSFNECGAKNSTAAACLATSQCLDPAWVACSTASMAIYAARVLIVVAVISLVPGLIAAGFDAVGRFPVAVLCFSDQGVFVFLGLLRAVFIGVSGGLGAAFWMNSFCGKNLSSIAGSQIGSFPFTILAAFILNMVSIAAAVLAPRPSTESKRKKRHLAMRSPPTLTASYEMQAVPDTAPRDRRPSVGDDQVVQSAG